MSFVYIPVPEDLWFDVQRYVLERSGERPDRASTETDSADTVTAPVAPRPAADAPLSRDQVVAIRDHANLLWAGRPPVTGPNIQEIWSALGGRDPLFGLAEEIWERYATAPRANRALFPGGVLPEGLEELVRPLTPRTFYGRKVAAMLLAIHRFRDGGLGQRRAEEASDRPSHHPHGTTPSDP